MNSDMFSKIKVHLNSIKIHMSSIKVHSNSIKVHVNSINIRVSPIKIHLNSTKIHLHSIKIQLNSIKIHMNSSLCRNFNSGKVRVLCVFKILLKDVFDFVRSCKKFYEQKLNVLGFLCFV